jgi:hypothetical protein
MSQIGISQESGDSQTTRGQLEATQSAKSLYGPDFTINPMSGQVFIQIVFNVASDYDESGLMDVSDKIQFYENNDVDRAGIKGLVYKVNQVQSSFSRGAFTQQLDCVIVTASQLVNVEDKNSADTVPQSTGGGGTGGGETSENTRSNVRRPTYSSDEEADRADQQSNYTIEEDFFGGLASPSTVQPYADDDKKLPDIPAPETREEAVAVFGQESVDTFGSTGGGAALAPVRTTRRTTGASILPQWMRSRR